MKNLFAKLKTSAISVLPVAIIVLILAAAFAKLQSHILIQFAVSAVFLILGMALFSMGADIAMVPACERIGAKVISIRKIWIIIPIIFFIGLFITIAEPDLLVLAEILSSAVNRYYLIISVGVGVGFFLVVALLRVIFKVNLRIILLLSYLAVFILGFFVPKEYFALAFDSGGVTTGPITVPIIMAIGIGVATAKSGSDMQDNFGYVALCTLGPIIAVMVMGLFADTSNLSYSSQVIVGESVVSNFLTALPLYIRDVAIALLPILAYILIFNVFMFKTPKRTLLKMFIGMFYVFIGLVLFLTGANVGFSPLGNLLAQSFVAKNLKWLLIPVGMLIGFFIVAAEPTVPVLAEQVEEISGGTIKKKNIFVALMIGVSLAVGLAMLRTLTGLSFWYFVGPGYAIALILNFFIPKIFVPISFDSGSVASGPMTATFLLPFAIGAAASCGGNILTDAMGIVAMVTMMPIISIQVLGIIAKYKSYKLAKVAVPQSAAAEDIVTQDDIIEFGKNEKPIKNERRKRREKETEIIFDETEF